MRGRRIGPLALAALAICSCQEKVPDGRIMFKNDSQDSSYNVVDVSGNGLYRSLKPGQTTLLPPSTRAFSVSRRYKDYTRFYSVSCPAITGRGIFIKLIDVHVNRIAGGCKTTSASKG
jgi:hypothetical protein